MVFRGAKRRSTSIFCVLAEGGRVPLSATRDLIALTAIAC